MKRGRHPGQGPGMLQFRSRKSGTGTEIGTHFKIWDRDKKFAGHKIEKSGIGDWDRESDLRDEGFRESTLEDFSGYLRIPGLGPGD